MDIVDLRKLLCMYSSMDKRTKKQELEYQYVDKAITYGELKQMAIQGGNKEPDKNCLVKDAFDKFKKAEQELRDYVNSNK